MQEWVGAVVAVVLALVALALGIALLRSRARTDRALAQARAETAQLRAQLDAIELRLQTTAQAAPARAESEYVITDLGRPRRDDSPDPHPEVGTALFADLVLRETVVKAAALAHGVRRGLAPETRNRIRFEMKREVKRSRKQRKADVRRARREWEAHQRAATDEEGSAA